MNLLNEFTYLKNLFDSEEGFYFYLKMENPKTKEVTVVQGELPPDICKCEEEDCTCNEWCKYEVWKEGKLVSEDEAEPHTILYTCIKQLEAGEQILKDIEIKTK